MGTNGLIINKIGLNQFLKTLVDNKYRTIKNNSKIFRDKGLQIIINEIVDYLELTLNFNDDTYCPFHNLSSTNEIFY